MSAGRRRALALCLAATVATLALLLALARPERDLGVDLAPERSTATRTDAPPPPSNPALIEPERSAVREQLTVRGRVSTSTGEAVDAVRVDLWLVEEDGNSSYLGQTASAADGTYRFEAVLAPLDLHASRRFALRGCASDATHGADRRAVQLQSARSGELELDFRLTDAALLAGRVVGPDGALVAGARVSLQHNPSSPRELAQVRSARDGTFTLLATHRGTAQLVARVVARAEGIGSAVTAWAEFERGPHELGELALRGPGRLAGTLRDGTGAPFADVELAALPPQLAGFAPDAPEVIDFLLEHESGAGLTVARATTGSDGHFELAGLAPGAYVLACTRSGLALERPERRYATGEEHIELALATHLLEVRVVGPDGEGLPGIAVWCSPLEGAASEGDADRARWERTTDELGRAAFALPPGARTLGLFASDPERGSADLVLALDAPRVEHTLTLGARAEPARLRVRIRGDEDEVLPWYRVELRAERSNARALAFRVLPRSNELGLILPAGRYRLRLTPEDVHLCTCDPLPFDAPDPVTLVPDEETLVDLAPRRGGRISVALAGELANVDAVEAVADSSVSSEGKVVEKHNALRFELARGTDPPRPLHFVERCRGSKTLRANDIEWLCPGDSATSAPLEPGDYTLRCLADDLLVEERRIAVVERHVTQLELSPR